MNVDFLSDLDEYFVKKYSNRSKLSAIPGFEIPVAREEENFIVPPEKYKLSNQKNCSELLKVFKGNLIDKDFSFDIVEVKFKQRIKDIRRNDVFYRIFPDACKKYSVDRDNLYTEFTVSEEVWKSVIKGKYYPSKNLILAIILACGINFRDGGILLGSCGYEYDFESVRDCVVSYLVEYKIFNRSLIEKAFEEYSITSIPLKKE